jgi:hypothetical protein
MSIRAAIEARLLGIRLLRLRAAIDVLPADIARTTATAERSNGDSDPRSLRTTPGRALPAAASGRSSQPAAIGSGLPDAARALRAGSRELQEARKLMMP